jgi:hypothetical protein
MHLLALFGAQAEGTEGKWGGGEESMRSTLATVQLQAEKAELVWWRSPGGRAFSSGFEVDATESETGSCVGRRTLFMNVHVSEHVRGVACAGTGVCGEGRKGGNLLGHSVYV